jgi:hypothetical protein
VADLRTFMSGDYVTLWVEPATNGKKAHWATMTTQEWVEGLGSGKHKYHAVELLNTKLISMATRRYSRVTTRKPAREGVECSQRGPIL